MKRPCADSLVANTSLVQSILVIDDQADLRIALEFTLTREGKGVLQKPFSSEQLLLTVSRALPPPQA